MTTYSAFRADGPDFGSTSTSADVTAHNFKNAPAGRADGRWERSAAATLLAARGPAPEPDPKPPLWRRMISWAFTIIIVATTIFLWPAALGGSTRLVIVSGTSMEPTYDLGDIVITRDRARSAVGDAVVFEIPNGNAQGSLVIHRIVEVDADGHFITKGDNRETADTWPLTEDDIVGQPLLHVPKGGLFVRFLQQWWVIAILVGLLVVFVLWPSDDEQEQEDPDDERIEDPTVPVVLEATPGVERALANAMADDTPVASPAVVFPEPEVRRLLVRKLDVAPVDDVLAVDTWATGEIDQAVMDDAIEWLEAQLADAASTSSV